MIVYNKLFALMKERGLSTYKIRKDNIIPQGTLTLLNNNKSVTIETINKLCAALDYQPGAFAWKLRNNRIIKPIPVKGALSLWNFEDESKLEIIPYDILGYVPLDSLPPETNTDEPDEPAQWFKDNWEPLMI